MNFLFANPAGLWALLAMPVILLIHFLQERSRKVRVSTLFLLERVKPESVSGARFEKLRNSVPLWLQLLAALLLAWLLAEPRWIKEDSRQTVVVVLDSSASMSAYFKPTEKLLSEKLKGWSRSAAHTDWHLIESDTRQPTLYAGDDLGLLLQAFTTWQPRRGTHRPDEAIVTARGLVKEHGIVIYVTDRETEVPADVALLSAAEPIANVGFAGVEVTLLERSGDTPPAMKWKALVRNYGDEPLTRQWWLESADPAHPLSAEPSNIELAPRQTVVLSGELSPQIERASLVLTADDFTLDDILPLQKPQPRLVKAELRVAGPLGDTLRKMLSALDGLSLAANAQTKDLVLSELGTPVETHAIQMVNNGDETTALDGNPTVAETHALTRDLNWMGLLTPRPVELSLTENDEPLLWKGDRVLAILRHDQTTQGQPIERLLFAWDLRQSNAARHPAMLVLLHRFVTRLREAQREPWADNFEMGQVLQGQGLREKGNGDAMKLRVGDQTEDFLGHAPEQIGFFEVLQNNTAFIRGAAHFADVREADFREAKPVDTIEARRWEAALKQSEADPFTPIWVLLVLGCLLGSWAWKTGTGSLKTEHLNLKTA
jgi:hypothetical protein